LSLIRDDIKLAQLVRACSPYPTQSLNKVSNVHPISLVGPCLFVCLVVCKAATGCRREDRVRSCIGDPKSIFRYLLACSRRNPRTATISQYRFNKTKQHTHTANPPRPLKMHTSGAKKLSRFVVARDSSHEERVRVLHQQKF